MKNTQAEQAIKLYGENNETVKHPSFKLNAGIKATKLIYKKFNITLKTPQIKF